MRKAHSDELRLLIIAFRRWKRPIIKNGLVKKYGLKPRQFNLHQLAIGTKIEFEHTSVPEIALEIAMAHLKENPRYYEILEKSGL